jgi:uncharacterized protein (DUF2336 family)
LATVGSIAGRRPERALATGDYGPLGEVVERWWRAARLEDHGGESWQRQKHLAEEGR